jgi:hypothetical protein
MNQAIIQKYLDQYKKELPRIRIHHKENYKWQAVKHFQDNWDETAKDFAEMLKEALSKTSNLMDSGNYFPREVIVKAANENPELTRNAFLELFDENADLIERIEGFRSQMKILNANKSLGKKEYQDDRAVLVYLTLHYPDKYYFYKFGMFKSFCEKTEHDYQPKRGAFANIEAYCEVCAYLKTILVADEQLVQLHRDYLPKDGSFDTSFNILTQDFVFAVQNYLSIDADEPSNSETAVLPLKTNNLITPFASDIADPEVPERVETTTYRILRDTKKARGIKCLYDYCCQICGETIELGNAPYSEAHHIKPLGNPHNGPDHESNIISVCPNHHVLLDYFAFKLDTEQLNLHLAHHINSNYIDYHNLQFETIRSSTSPRS